MIKAAIEKILSLAPPTTLELGEKTYTDKPLTLVSPPHASTLEFSTLRGLCDIVQREIESYPNGLIIKADERSVNVYTDMCCEDLKRDRPYCAEADTPSIYFDRYISYEDMMITLKSKFVPTAERDELIKLLGTIVEENRTAVSDDGFTQSVNVKQGIAMVGSKAINPIVKLKPYRTFVEVDQPESEFLIRLRSGGEVALFEADGGAWKLEARKNIAVELNELLGDLSNVCIVE